MIPAGRLAPPAPAEPGRVHYGWVIVGAAFSVLFLTYGAQYSFGLFFNALIDEFGWSRASLSGVFSLYAGAYTFLGLVSGRLTDRWGPRAVVGLGGVCLGAGLALSGSVHAIGSLYATYLLAALGMSAAFVPCTATVARWFNTRRGLAVGLAVGGAGVGIFACPPLVALLLGRAGWRLGYAIVGLGLALLLALLSRLFAREPAERGLLPYGALPGHADTGQSPVERWRPARALRQPSFLALVGVYTCTWATVFLPLVHLAPLARDLGLGAVVGASALSVLGAGSLVGRLGLGVVSDGLGRRPTLGLALALQALSFVVLALARDAPTLLGAAALYGFAYGAVTALMPAIVADFYGAAQAGSLVGLIFGLAGPPGALGPLLGGLVFDLTGGYTWAFGIGGGLNLLALGFLLAARPPGQRPRMAPGRTTGLS